MKIQNILDLSSPRPFGRLSTNIIFRSSHRRCYLRKDVLKNVAKFTEQAGGLELYQKRDAGTGVFLCFAKFLKARFKDNLWWLLLIIHPPKICSGEAVLHVLEITKKLKRMPEM